MLRAAQVTVLIALLGAPPAFGAVQPWAWVALELLVLLGLVLWALDAVGRGWLEMRWSPLFVPMGLFLLLAAVQYWGHFTLDPIATREALLKLTSGLALFFLAVQLLGREPVTSLPKFGWVVVLYSFAMGLFAILQYCSSNGRIYWTIKPNGWTFGPYVNHDHYAGLMEILIPIAVGYLLSRPEKDPARSALGFALLVPVASLLLSGSRGGLVALLAEVVVFGVILLCTYRRRRRSSIAILAAGLTAAAALFFWLDFGDVSTRLATAFQFPRAAEATLGERVTMSRDSLRILKAHPAIGIGLGSFENVYPQYQTFASDSAVIHAHDDYAEGLAETGLAGGALMALALLLFLRRAFAKLPEKVHGVGWVQLGAAVGCVGLLVHSLADFNLHIPANAAWFCVALAVALLEPAAPGPLRA